MRGTLWATEEDEFRLDGPTRIAFSGGRTSGFLLWKTIQHNGGRLPDDCIVTFANTGREVEETLEFVRDCAANWHIHIRWVEYCREQDQPVVRPTQGRKLIGCHGFKEVTFETASRSGEPFEALIDVKSEFRAEAKGEPPILPNPTDRWCSAELKARTMDRFMQFLGYDEYEVFVGIRADESRRVAPLKRNDTELIKHRTPLADSSFALRDVLKFWKTQPFDLKLSHDPVMGTYEGNCDLCYLKSVKKIRRLAVERPETFDWWAAQERKTGQRFRNYGPSYVQMADSRVSLEMCDGEDLGACMCTD